MKRVEQIFKNRVVFEYDEKKSSKEIEIILNKTFNVINRNHYEFKINLENKEITFLIKNITYLGHPHPFHTKRIQLSNGWEQKLKNNDTFIIGVYNYKCTRLFVYFDKTNYVNRRLNNSSAHIWTNDLLKGFQDGVFQKVDIRKNEIFVIREDKLFEFVKEKFVLNKKAQTKEFEFIENFKNDIGKKWNGISCYKQMIRKNYSNKYQAEWAGFYFEYRFEEFLNSNPKYKSICEFNRQKNIGSIDLDVKFKKGFYGDLKTHSNNSSGILGNDAKTIKNSVKKDGKIWYIVLNHDTIKDIDMGSITSKFWNKVQGKLDLLSYSKKMKHSVTLDNFQILEINTYNEKYLTPFNQGLNSNGLPRNPKIKINKKHLKNFLIYDSTI